jgi:2-haloacid dehalogenase
MALAASGGSARFADLAAVALDEVAAGSRRPAPAGFAAEVLDAMGRVPLHPDVSPALEHLAAAGVPAYALTNGGADYARSLLQAGGVADRLAGVLSVESVGHWKPRPEPYHWAAEVARVPADRLALVAVHPWDAHGAASAGLVSAWVNRTGRPHPAVFAAPVVQADDLVGAVDRLLSRPGD